MRGSQFYGGGCEKAGQCQRATDSCAFMLTVEVGEARVFRLGDDLYPITTEAGFNVVAVQGRSFSMRYLS